MKLIHTTKENLAEDVRAYMAPKVCDFCNEEESDLTGEIILKRGGDESAMICESCLDERF